MTPFDFVNSLNNKNYIYDEYQSGYNQYVINLAFAYYEDTILFANELNMYQNISDKMHYDFYYYGIDKKKRWSKWNKKSTEDKELIEGIAQYYKINYNRANYMMTVISTVEKAELEKFVKSKGGK